MGTSRRKRVGFGLAAGLVIAGTVGVTSMTASGNTTTAAPTVDYGTLTIDLTDRAGTITLTQAGRTFTQALATETPCSTLVAREVLPPVTEGLPNVGGLLRFTPTGGTNPNVQLPGTSIGVTDGANCGSPAGVIGPGETLTLSLGTFLPSNVMIGSGTLRIGKTNPQDKELELKYGNGSFGDPISIANGGEPITVPRGTNTTSITLKSTATQSSRGLSLRGNTVLHLVVPAPPAAPGAPTEVRGVAGNNQVVLSWTAPGDDGRSPITDYIIEYKPTESTDWLVFVKDASTSTSATVTSLTNGIEYEFRVRAQNDVDRGEPSHPPVAVTPVLSITDAEVDCGGEVPLMGVSGLIAREALFVRLLNVNEQGGLDDVCEKVTVDIVITDDYVLWDNTKDPTGQVQATMEIQWAGVNPALFNDVLRPINYEGDLNGNFFELEWCTDYNVTSGTLPQGPIGYEVDENGNYVLDENGDKIEIIDTVPWCLVSTTEELINGLVYQTDVMFGAGDPVRTNTLR